MGKKTIFGLDMHGPKSCKKLVKIILDIKNDQKCPNLPKIILEVVNVYNYPKCSKTSKAAENNFGQNVQNYLIYPKMSKSVQKNVIINFFTSP